MMLDGPWNMMRNVMDGGNEGALFINLIVQ